MDSATASSIFFIALMVLFSAYFSATETAFSSLNRIRVKNMADAGSKRAQLVMQLSEHYDKLLTTILVGNNIVNIAAASTGTVLFIRHFGDLGTTLSTIVITLSVLIFGEISPKSLAKESPEGFAMFSAPFMRVLVTLLAPVNFIFGQWQKLLAKLFKVGSERGITEAELLIMVEEARQEGAIEEGDQQLINNAIDFNDSKASEILTPRVDIEAVPDTATHEEITSMFLETGFSRLPVYSGSVDNIIGVIHLRDFFGWVVNGHKGLPDILSKAVYIAPSIKISSLLKILQKEKSHMAVVTDDFGGTMGIITMEDILEELVGEIWDESDEIVEPFIKVDENTYKVICSADIGKLLDMFKISGDFDSSTVSGWIMEQLSRVPEEGDMFHYENLMVTVTKTDNHRVLECMVAVQA